MIQRWLMRVDRWAQKLIASPGAQLPDASNGEPLRHSEKLFSFAVGFLATSLISLILFKVHRGGLVPVFTLLCVAIAANAPERRRKYWLIGIVAVIPLQIVAALISALFPWH